MHGYLVAELRETIQSGQRFRRVCFGHLPNTWRQNKDPSQHRRNIISKGKLLAYLNPVPSQELELDDDRYDKNNLDKKAVQRKKTRVIDRPDLQCLIPGFPNISDDRS